MERYKNRARLHSFITCTFQIAENKFSLNKFIEFSF